MTLIQQLLKVVDDISDEKLREIIDFAQYIKEKDSKVKIELDHAWLDEYEEGVEALAK